MRPSKQSRKESADIITETIIQLAKCSNRIRMESDLSARIKKLKSQEDTLKRRITLEDKKLVELYDKTVALHKSESALREILRGLQDDINRSKDQVALANLGLVASIGAPAARMLAEVFPIIQRAVPEKQHQSVQMFLVSIPDATLMGLTHDWTIEVPWGFVNVIPSPSIRPGYAAIVLRDNSAVFTVVNLGSSAAPEGQPACQCPAGGSCRAPAVALPCDR